MKEKQKLKRIGDFGREPAGAISKAVALPDNRLRNRVVSSTQLLRALFEYLSEILDT